MGPIEQGREGSRLALRFGVLRELCVVASVAFCPKVTRAHRKRQRSTRCCVLSKKPNRIQGDAASMSERTLRMTHPVERGSGHRRVRELRLTHTV